MEGQDELEEDIYDAVASHRQEMAMRYPVHILTIKLWEWEQVLEVGNMDLIKNGPSQQCGEQIETACTRIKEIKSALEKLKV